MLTSCVSWYVVCNYYVTNHKNVASTRETLHVRFAVRIAGNADIKEHMKSLSPGIRSSMSEAFTLVRLILVMPATNAVSERSTSALRVKQLFTLNNEPVTA